MKILKTIFCSLFFLYFLNNYPVFPGETARTSGDRINVRAKPVLGSEIVTQLDLYEEVDVIEKRDQWTTINRPPHSKCWIHGDYITDYNITTDRVNVRCGPGVAFPILCHIDRGTGVNVLEKSVGWVRIEPPCDFSVWVSSEFIEYPPYKEKEIETAEKPKKDKIEGTVELEESEEEDLDGTEEPDDLQCPVEKIQIEDETSELSPFIPTYDVPVVISAPKDELTGLILVSHAGTLQDMGVIINRPGTYKLISNDKWVCILSAETLDLNPYVNRLIRVEGIEVSPSSSWKVPVVEVKKLQVIR